MVNLALSLTEQKRRKVLLLDLGRQAQVLVKSMGLNPILSSKSMLQAEDLRNPKIIERITLVHPSGLEIITLSEEVFSGPLFRSIPSFLALLREMYDYVLVNTDRKSPRNSSGEMLDEIEETILDECDSVFYVCDSEPERGQVLKDQLTEGTPMKVVSL